jgi:hypothetical protein
MKTKNKFLLGTLATLLTFGLILTGCGDDDGDSGPAAATGVLDTLTHIKQGDTFAGATVTLTGATVAEAATGLVVSTSADAPSGVTVGIAEDGAVTFSAATLTAATGYYFTIPADKLAAVDGYTIAADGIKITFDVTASTALADSTALALPASPTGVDTATNLVYYIYTATGASPALATIDSETLKSGLTTGWTAVTGTSTTYGAAKGKAIVAIEFDGTDATSTVIAASATVAVATSLTVAPTYTEDDFTLESITAADSETITLPSPTGIAGAWVTVGKYFIYGSGGTITPATIDPTTSYSSLSGDNSWTAVTTTTVAALKGKTLYAVEFDTEASTTNVVVALSPAITVPAAPTLAQLAVTAPAVLPVATISLAAMGSEDKVTLTLSTGTWATTGAWNGANAPGANDYATIFGWFTIGGSSGPASVTAATINAAVLTITFNQGAAATTVIIDETKLDLIKANTNISALTIGTNSAVNLND